MRIGNGWKSRIFSYLFRFADILRDSIGLFTTCSS